MTSDASGQPTGPILPLHEEVPGQEMIAEGVRAEIIKILGPLQAVTSLISRWNGKLIVDTSLGESDVQAAVRPDNSIAIPPELFNRPDRWRSFLHELIHTLGEEVNRDEYHDNRGWEEAPVEMLQRALRREVLAKAQVDWSEEAIQQAEAIWPGNPYIAALEDIRQATGNEDIIGFCLRLKRTPVAQRSALLMNENRGNRQALMMISARAAILRDYYLVMRQ